MRAFISLASLSAVASAASVSPTQKVVQLLQDMSAKGKQRMKEEQISFAKFSQFCTNEQGSLASEIADGRAEMEAHEANILKSSTDASTLGDEIQQLNRDIAGYEGDKKAQEEDRASTHAAYVESQKDLAESVDALGRALVILKRQNYDRKQAASFLQTSAQLPPRAKALVQDFLALREDGEDDGDADFMARAAPQANAYEFQSGGIVGMLKKLEKKFKTELSQTEMAETNSRHAFEVAVQDLVASIKASTESAGKKTVTRNRALAAAGKSKKELATATATFNENTQTLGDLKVECNEKQLSFEEKQKLATDEIAALAEATQILAGDDVSGAAAAHLTPSSRLALIQIANRQKLSQQSDVLRFLAESGRKLGSEKLSLLAQRAANDPFLKVKKMIKAMVTKLMNEQNEEAETKGFCDKELKTNKLTRDRLASEMEKLSASFDQNSAEAKQLGETVARLAEEVAALDQAVAEAVSLRSAEKEKNEAAIADAKAAQSAVARATTVLKDFYSKAGAATAFLQFPKMGSDEWNALTPGAKKGNVGYGQGSEDKVDKGHKEGMQTFGDTYSGQQDSASGVLAMLEVILSDFANLETATSTAESSAQQNHERFLADSRRDKKVKSKQQEMSQSDKEAAEHDAAQAKRDLSATDDQARAADRYYESLKPKCVDEGVSFEERNAKRDEEIEALKQALEMLQPQD